MRSIELIQFSCEDHEKIDILMKEMQKSRIDDGIKELKKAYSMVITDNNKKYTNL